jgi:hypothetical protein
MATTPCKAVDAPWLWLWYKMALTTSGFPSMYVKKATPARFTAPNATAANFCPGPARVSCQFSSRRYFASEFFRELRVQPAGFQCEFRAPKQY